MFLTFSRFGLSYTTFIFSHLKLEAIGQYGLRVSVDITNTGSLEGAEVAQVYIHASSASVARPDIELKGFGKAKLLPGATKTVSVDLDVSFPLYLLHSFLY